VIQGRHAVTQLGACRHVVLINDGRHGDNTLGQSRGSSAWISGRKSTGGAPGLAAGVAPELVAGVASGLAAEGTRGGATGVETAGAGCRRAKTCRKSRACTGNGEKPGGTTGARRGLTAVVEGAPGATRGSAGEAPEAAHDCAGEAPEAACGSTEVGEAPPG
jgi:hypothetical protein